MNGRVGAKDDVLLSGIVSAAARGIDELRFGFANVALSHVDHHQSTTQMGARRPSFLLPARVDAQSAAAVVVACAQKSRLASTQRLVVAES